MYCRNCGYKLNDSDKFCSQCGQKVESINAVRMVELTCKKCGGTMTVEEGKTVLSCPFCSSKEMLVESDKVKIQQIRSQIYKEVQLNKQKTYKDIQTSKNETKSKAEKKNTIMLIFGILFLLGMPIVYKFGFVYSILFLIVAYILISRSDNKNNDKKKFSDLPPNVTKMIGIVFGMIFFIILIFLLYGMMAFA